jgi:hypothetical protein
MEIATNTEPSRLSFGTGTKTGCCFHNTTLFGNQGKTEIPKSPKVAPSPWAL